MRPSTSALPRTAYNTPRFAIKISVALKIFILIAAWLEFRNTWDFTIPETRTMKPLSKRSKNSTRIWKRKSKAAKRNSRAGRINTPSGVIDFHHSWKEKTNTSLEMMLEECTRSLTPAITRKVKRSWDSSNKSKTILLRISLLLGNCTLKTRRLRKKEEVAPSAAIFQATSSGKIKLRRFCLNSSKESTKSRISDAFTEHLWMNFLQKSSMKNVMESQIL